MDGPEIICRSISDVRIPDDFGNQWQYHSRSDRHSKIACWSTAFDLVQHCSQLRAHLENGTVVFGVNHSLTDFRTQRSKKLDLVFARPSSEPPSANSRTFRELGEQYGIKLDSAQRASLDRLPSFVESPVGSVLVALEAKACMTAHVKALPRLHDELDSSHQTTHGNSKNALAVGFVMVNASPEFISTDRNKRDLSGDEPTVTPAPQPRSAQRAIDKVAEIRRRSGDDRAGFDALGILVVNLRNDGTPMTLANEPSPRFTYDDMIRRTAHEYSAAFNAL